MLDCGTAQRLAQTLLRAAVGIPFVNRTIMAKKKKNTGVPYEKLVRGIFKAIHDQEEVATIAVEQNKTLKGKISTHQIDVYWKFQTGGIEHEVIAKAKDWRSAVKQGNLFHFKCVLDDLPNQPRGNFVTRNGYQQGAKDFAAAQRIILYELDEPPPKKNITITTLGWLKFTAGFRSFKESPLSATVSST
jgi:Restriction endonuclease